MADYLYGSAHVRSLENAMIGRDRILRIAESKSMNDAYLLLEEFGVEVLRDENGSALREETLLGVLKKAYETVYSLAPDSTPLRIWRYPYDCNNVKAAIKGFVRGIDPLPMMFDFGTVNVDEVIKMVSSGRFWGLSPSLLRAAGDAVSAYAKTKNPQKIDLILDRACYADMLSGARASQNEFVLRLVRAKIDLVNISIPLRILRMQGGEAGRSLLEEALLAGGVLDTGELLNASSKGEDALMELVARSEYSALASLYRESDRSGAAFDRLADNFWMDLILETKFIPVGLEVMVAFLLGHEYEVKNLRIVLTGREAGLSAKTVCERIRESYV